MYPYDLLVKSIDFANSELESFKSEKGLQDVLYEVLSSLFRKIIELGDGVRVCAENGLHGPAEVNYRALIEAYLAFKYIIEDAGHCKDRAIAYKIGYHSHQIKATDFNIGKPDISDSYKQYLEQAITHHRSEIEKKEFNDVLSEHNRVQNADRRGFIPKWYSLYNGPTSINQLAKRLEGNHDRDQQLIAQLYSFLSSGSHNYLALNGIYKNGNGDLDLHDVRDIFDPERDHYNLEPVRSIITSTIAKFTTLVYPEYRDNTAAFLSVVRKYRDL